MKNFERNYVRAVDGEPLAETERGQLERELAGRGLPANAIDREREFLARLGRDARRPELPSPDFFNSQVIGRIRGERRAAETRGGAAGTPQLAAAAWFRLALGGALCLIVATLMTLALRPYDRALESGLTTRVLSVKTYHDEVQATTLATDDDHYAVVWMSGLDFLPENHRIQ